MRCDEARNVQNVRNVLLVIPLVVFGFLAGRGVRQNDKGVFGHDSASIDVRRVPTVFVFQHDREIEP